MEKHNAYFEEFGRLCEEWSERHEAHLREEYKVTRIHGEGGEEMAIWHAVDEPFPYSQGACEAYRTWKFNRGEEILFDHYLMEESVHDFVEAFRKAGIETFVAIKQGRGLMKNIHWFVAEGCTMEGPCMVMKDGEEIMGIRFRV